MYVNADIGLLGDSICGLPIIYHFAEMYGLYEPLKVRFANKAISHLVPKCYNIEKVDSIPDGQTFLNVNASNAWNVGIWDLHMTQAHFRALGQPVPTLKNARPIFEFEQEDVPSFDYLISPYSRSDDKNNKLIPLERWQEVIYKLLGHKKTVGILGSGKYDTQVFTDVEYLFDLSLQSVASYICNVKQAVLSIDNGISHMMHALQMPHVLFYPKCLPKTWVVNPNENAIVVQDDPMTFSVDRMWATIEPTF